MSRSVPPTSMGLLFFFGAGEPFFLVFGLFRRLSAIQVIIPSLILSLDAIIFPMNTTSLIPERTLPAVAFSSAVALSAFAATFRALSISSRELPDAGGGRRGRLNIVDAWIQLCSGIVRAIFRYVILILEFNLVGSDFAANH